MVNFPVIQSAILYQNPEKTVFLLDLPTSISLAQGTSVAPSTSTIYSSPPLENPYPSTEPKSEAARVKVGNMVKMSFAERSEEFLVRALEEIRSNYQGCWCLPRQISPYVSTSRKGKRKFSHDQLLNDVASNVEPIPEMSMRNVLWDGRTDTRPLALNPYVMNEFSNEQKIRHQMIHNPHSTSISLSVNIAEQTYNIPPRSAFYLADIDDFSVADFSIAARSLYSTPTASAGPGQFDLVLLDPPWDNRSVRRSRQYKTTCQGSDPMLALKDMLGEHIAPRALIACWITNKMSVREQAIEMFRTWGVELAEEWTWLKTTIDGQPVSDIKGLWRKPYEVLLLGRKSDLPPRNFQKSCFTQCQIQQKIIVAMPDFHSRKPCLKELFDTMVSDSRSYRGLEIFARNLTSGWCSWGNESIKYNWQGHWSDNCV